MSHASLSSSSSSVPSDYEDCWRAVLPYNTEWELDVIMRGGVPKRARRGSGAAAVASSSLPPTRDSIGGIFGSRSRRFSAGTGLSGSSGESGRRASVGVVLEKGRGVAEKVGDRVAGRKGNKGAAAMQPSESTPAAQLEGESDDWVRFRGGSRNQRRGIRQWIRRWTS